MTHKLIIQSSEPLKDKPVKNEPIKDKLEKNEPVKKLFKHTPTIKQQDFSNKESNMNLDVSEDYTCVGCGIHMTKPRQYCGHYMCNNEY